MCSPSPPPPPDYLGAANAQGAANEAAARIQGRINNPNVINPNGTQTVTWDGDTPTLTQTLSPAQQALLDSRNTTQLSLSELANQGAGAARGIVGTPVNFNGAPGPAGVYQPLGAPRPMDVSSLPGLASVYQPSKDLPAMPKDSSAIRDQVIQAMMGRSNIAIGQQADQTNSDLIARGIHPGTEAYTREQDALNRERVDANQQAQIAGGDAAAKAYQEDLSTRQQAQNEALANSSQTFGQALTAQQQAAANQGQQFQQGGQSAQLLQSQQQQQNAQQTAARVQAITEALARRQIPLNEITALMSGSQVTNPFAVPGYQGNSTVAPAPIFGAATQQGQYNTDAYNARAAGANAGLTGLFGLGSAFAGSGPGAAALAAMF